jgi:hypothetical protein
VSITPERLREFFAPHSLAVVGASDTSGWAQFILASSAAAGFSSGRTASASSTRTRPPGRSR